MELIQSVAGRTERQQAAITLALSRRCWPRDPADRLDPVAVQWVRRWAPARMMPAVPRCSCAAGRCPVCN